MFQALKWHVMLVLVLLQRTELVVRWRCAPQSPHSSNSRSHEEDWGREFFRFCNEDGDSWVQKVNNNKQLFHCVGNRPFFI